jgi:hypothetical protein
VAMHTAQANSATVPRFPREIAPRTFWFGCCLEVSEGTRILHNHNSCYLMVGDKATVLIDTAMPFGWKTLRGELASALGDRRRQVGRDAGRADREGRQLPDAHWGQVCWRLDQYALAYANRILEAKRAQAQRDHAEAMRRFEQAGSGGSSSGGGSGGGYSVPSASTADADRSRAEHQRVMQQYQRENQQIRQEIKAIDRKYGC